MKKFKIRKQKLQKYQNLMYMPTPLSSPPPPFVEYRKQAGVDCILYRMERFFSWIGNGDRDTWTNILVEINENICFYSWHVVIENYAQWNE